MLQVRLRLECKPPHLALVLLLRLAELVPLGPPSRRVPLEEE